MLFRSSFIIGNPSETSAKVTEAYEFAEPLPRTCHSYYQSHLRPLRARSQFDFSWLMVSQDLSLARPLGELDSEHDNVKAAPQKNHCGRN